MLDEIRNNGLNVELSNGGQDLFVTPREKISPKMRDFLKDNKRQIIEELRKQVYELTIGPFKPTKIATPSSAKVIVTFVIGETTEEIAEYTLPTIARYAENCQADLVVVRDDQMPDFPIGNKLRFGEIARQYDRALLLDCDIHINDHAPNIFNRHGSGVWMHSDVSYVTPYGLEYLTKEQTSMAMEHNLEVLHRATAKATGESWYNPPEYSLPFFNTGVILLDNQTARMWKLPDRPLFLSHTAEQAWIDLMLSNQTFIKRLDSKWNWLAFGRSFQQYAHGAYFVHLANCSHTERMRFLRLNTRSLETIT